MVEENWKEKLIAEYVLLQKENENILQEMTNNQELSILMGQYREITRKADALKKPYHVRQGNIDDRVRHVKELLIESWDIEERTYKCDIGIATLRITKSLIIKNKTQLMQRLSEVLTRHFAEACEYIKTFDLTKIRKIKEINLLDDAIVSWDEKKSVAIKITEDK